MTERRTLNIDDLPDQAEPTGPILLSAPAYSSLAGILQAALDHAAEGKGHQRHAQADDKPFLEQPIIEIARMLGGMTGHSYQIMKKAQEANRMVDRRQYNAACGELLGIINYAAAAILVIREIETESGDFDTDKLD